MTNGPTSGGLGSPGAGWDGDPAAHPPYADGPAPSADPQPDPSTPSGPPTGPTPAYGAPTGTHQVQPPQYGGHPAGPAGQPSYDTPAAPSYAAPPPAVEWVASPPPIQQFGQPGPHFQVPPGSQPPWGPPPTKSRTPLLLGLIAAAVVIALIVTVVVLATGGSEDVTAASTSAAAITTDTGADVFTVEHITQTLDAAKTAAGAALAYRITMYDDGTAVLETCNEAAEKLTVFSLDPGQSATGQISSMPCFAGFEIDEIDAGVVAKIVNASDLAQTGENISVELYAWDSYTPTVSVLEDEDSFTSEEYTLDGELLGMVVDPYDSSERDDAVAALVEASGITEAVEVCVDLTIDSVTVGGKSPEHHDKMAIWQYTNYPALWDLRPMTATHTLDPLAVDLDGPLDRIDQIEALFETEDPELGVVMVCQTTEHDPNKEVTVYYLTEDDLGYDNVHYVLTDDAGTVIEKK